MRVSGIVSVMAGVLVLYFGIVHKDALSSFFQPLIGLSITTTLFNSTLIIALSVVLIIIGTVVIYGSRNEKS